jgi:uncharacterized protein YdaU (DUF1376 family)
MAARDRHLPDVDIPYHDFHNTTLLIDSVDFRIENPIPYVEDKWKEESWRSYKFKQKFAVSYIIICDMDDIFTFLSGYFPSNRSDSWKLKRCWDDIREHTYHEDYDTFSGDSKFTVLKNEPYNCTCYTRFIKPKGRQLTTEQVRYNTAFSNFRGNEERLFGALRNMFKMFSTSTVFRGPPRRHHSYLLLAMAIYNTEKRIKMGLPYDF